MKDSLPSYKAIRIEGVPFTSILTDQVSECFWNGEKEFNGEGYTNEQINSIINCAGAFNDLLNIFKADYEGGETVDGYMEIKRGNEWVEPENRSEALGYLTMLYSAIDGMMSDGIGALDSRLTAIEQTMARMDRNACMTIEAEMVGVDIRCCEDMYNTLQRYKEHFRLDMFGLLAQQIDITCRKLTTLELKLGL